MSSFIKILMAVSAASAGLSYAAPADVALPTYSQGYSATVEVINNTSLPLTITSGGGHCIEDVTWGVNTLAPPNGGSSGPFTTTSKTGAPFSGQDCDNFSGNHNPASVDIYATYWYPKGSIPRDRHIKCTLTIDVDQNSNPLSGQNTVTCDDSEGNSEFAATPGAGNPSGPNSTTPIQININPTP